MSKGQERFYVTVGQAVVYWVGTHRYLTKRGAIQAAARRTVESQCECVRTDADSDDSGSGAESCEFCDRAHESYIVAVSLAAERIKKDMRWGK